MALEDFNNLLVEISKAYNKYLILKTENDLPDLTFFEYIDIMFKYKNYADRE